jgi:NAD dependent epimerase/dehydratase family enzyme
MTERLICCLLIAALGLVLSAAGGFLMGAAFGYDTGMNSFLGYLAGTQLIAWIYPWTWR